MRLIALLSVVIVCLFAGLLQAEPLTGGSGSTPIPFAHERVLEKQKAYHWYELTDSQDKKLREALKKFHTNRPILILSATGDSLGLAEDFDLALRDAGIKSSIDRPMDVVDGLHCTNLELANLITTATGIKVIVDAADSGPTDSLVLNFGRKIK